MRYCVAALLPLAAAFSSPTAPVGIRQAGSSRVGVCSVLQLQAQVHVHTPSPCWLDPCARVRHTSGRLTLLQPSGAKMLQAESVSTRRDFLVKAALPALLVTPSIAAADSTGKFTSKVCVVTKFCD